MLYLMNVRHHYFSIADDVAFDTDALRDCRIFDNALTMYEAVAAHEGLPMSEVEDSALMVERLGSRVVCIDAQGAIEDIEGDLAAYLSQYPI